MIRQMTKTQAEELKKKSATQKTRSAGEIYPEIFDSDEGIIFQEGMKLDVAIIWLGAFEMQSSDFPKIRCPVCGKEEGLIPYFCGGSILSGAHIIKFYCLNCHERIVFNDKISYFHKIRDYALKNRKNLSASSRVKTSTISKNAVFISNKNSGEQKNDKRN